MTYRKYEIRTLTNEPWLWNVCDFMSAWRWTTEAITHALAETHGAIDYCEVEILEHPDHGDVLTVRGEMVGLLPVPGA